MRDYSDLGIPGLNSRQKAELNEFLEDRYLVAAIENMCRKSIADLKLYPKFRLIRTRKARFSIVDFKNTP